MFRRISVFPCFLALLCFTASTLAQPLTGTKTIGGATPDYPTIHAAICSLNVHGTATGGVTFLIRGGTYNEPPDSIYNVPGTGTNARIEFRLADTLGVNIIKSGLGIGGGAGYEIANSDYITFDGSHSALPTRRLITINIGDSLVTHTIWISNGSDYCCLKNLNVNNSRIAYVNNEPCSPVFASYDSHTTPYTGCLFDSVLNCRITGGWNSICLTSDSTTFMRSWMIADNELTGFYQCGIYLNRCDQLTVRHNTIHNSMMNAGTSYGIQFYYSTNGIIERNFVYALDNSSGNAVVGITVDYLNEGVLGATISNNMINLDPTTGVNPVYGIYRGNYGRCNILFNTIRIGGLGDSYNSYAIHYYSPGGFQDTVANNIFINERSSVNLNNYHICMFIYKNPWSFAFCDYNVLSNVIHYPVNDNRYTARIDSISPDFGTRYYRTLADLRAVLGYTFDSHSIDTAPRFIGIPNLHINPAIPTPVYRAGIPFASVRYDFDGDLRDSLHPCIGADEFIPVSVREHNNQLPSAFLLEPVYPNPFNSTTTIRFSLPVASQTKLELFDTNGRLVTTLQNLALMSAGTHRIQFDGSQLASGMYFVRMSAGKFSAQQKVVLLK